MNERSPFGHPSTVAAVVLLGSALLAAHGLLLRLPLGLWPTIFLHPDLDDINQLLAIYSFLPRLVISLLCGAALSLAGVIFQQVMRNPIAEPTTLGASAGASLALTLTFAFAPDLLTYGREWIALTGASLATVAVFALASGRSLAPLTLVLVGLIVDLYCGAVTAGIQLFENPYMTSVYLWGAGSLVQQDWTSVFYLLPRLAIAIAIAAMIVRPLTILGIEDEGARSLGLSLWSARLIALIVAVALSAFVVSAAGIIGFIGFAAPALARLAGARRLGQQLLWAPLLGAGLVCMTDQVVQLTGDGQDLLPTGTATALLGAPLLLWMLPRLRGAGELHADNAAGAARRSIPPRVSLLVAVLALALGMIFSLHLGKDGHGWQWATWQQLEPILRWRMPRMLGALAAGAMLAVAGTLLQRMTANPMASPEILGISAGASLGMVLLVMVCSDYTRPMQLSACAGGALLVLVANLLIGRRASYAPTLTLLAGIATGALVSTLVAVFMASGDPHVAALRNWMAGATDLISWPQALYACVTAAILLAICIFTGRWLAILPLGSEVPQAIGVNLRTTRLVVLLLVSLLTAGAVLTIGPLGFIGLMAPHIARKAGIERPLPHLAGSAIAGALIMVVADWLGRTLMFPYQIPAGLVATLIGGPYLMVLLRKSAGSTGH